MSRAPGEAIVIGKSKLVVRRIRPTVGIVCSRRGLARDFNFSLDRVEQQPEFVFDGARIKLLGLGEKEVLLGIEAPDNVLIRRDEFNRPRAQRINLFDLPNDADLDPIMTPPEPGSHDLGA